MANPQPPTDDSSFPLALRPWTADGENDEPLIMQLARISHQFGQYRHVTEEKLQKMIADEESGISQAEEPQAEEEEQPVDDPKKRAEELAKAKAEMFRHINDAQQEVLYAIDFLGLLLSKDSPRAKEQMSPALRTSGIPEGSFGYDKWPVKESDARQKKQEELVSRGWTMQSLGASADNLLQAATKLEKEVRKETQYWGQILSITKRGWSLRRVPREPGTLGVTFGFAEASDQFKARGFAPLRTRDDGSIILDQALVQQPKSIRVRIVQKGNVLGSSHQGSLSFAPESDQEIEDLIRRARDSLFEQELFHEMTMESRGLLSNNVRFRDHVIIIPTGLAHECQDASRREIHVDLVSTEDIEQPSKSRTEDELAQDIALTLRMLLSHAHSQRLQRRSVPPPPLTDRKRPDQPPPIIRTILNYIHHHAATALLRTHLEAHSQAISRADLKLDYQIKSAHSDIVKLMTQPLSKANRIPLLDTLMTALARPLHTVFTVALPSSASDPLLKQDIKITLRTIVQPPIQGTEISVLLPTALTRLLYLDAAVGTSSQKRLSFDTMEDLTSYLDYTLAVDLAHNLIKTEAPKFSAMDRQPELSHLVKADKDGDSSKDHTVARKTMKLEVQLSGPGHLSLRWWTADGKGDGGHVVWGADKEETRSLKEIVQKLQLFGDDSEGCEPWWELYYYGM